MKRVLIITYYWPPAGGIEVQRVVKFAKYLPEFGWDPCVLTVRGGTAQASDPALVREVAHVEQVQTAPSLEPHTLFYALTGRKKNSGGAASEATASARRTHRLGEFVRLNLFVPDARIGWYPGAVKAGSEAIRKWNPDLMFSTAPPYTVHWIARRLQRRHGLPWVADFRDPWVENYAYNTVYRFPWVRAINERMERSVLNRANRVVVATPGQKTLQGAKAEDGEDRFHCITNGHDRDEPPAPKLSSQFYLSYFGSLSAQRVPVALFDRLRQLLKTREDLGRDFRFRFAGRITPEARALIEARLPKENCVFLPMLPHHEYWEKVVEHQLLLVLVDRVPHNDMIIPAKCFEMMTTGNPLLAVGPAPGDTERMLKQSQSGTLCAYEDADAMEQEILRAYSDWKSGGLNEGPRAHPEIHRRQLTRQLAEVFERV